MGVDLGGASASKVANKIARNLYHYLRDHLISPHQNRKLSHFVAFLKSRHGGDFQAFEIDDAAILAFWLQPPDCAEVQSDYRNFRNVMRGFIDLHRAVLQGQERLALAHARQTLAMAQSLTLIAAHSQVCRIHKRLLTLPYLRRSKAPIASV